MTNRFEFIDPDGDGLVLLPWPSGGRPGPVVGLIATPREGKSAGVFIPLDRLEEVIAGLRDMARQASGQPAPGPCSCGYPNDEDTIHPADGKPCYMRDIKATVEGAGA
ncbi:hypothetical protein ACFWA6_14020 [Streptomyces sp. NPDC060020]|uniref:hypothetical protein n=1 Tax=Streptomyces sp. NPDC060020 TaxID=3347038 RepID=UPI0036CE798C